MARLTEQEQQEIIRFLKAGKPPDNYRYLLFEDKREVELVWNGKTGEVYSVMLPFQGKAKPDRSEKTPDREGEQGQTRHRHARAVNQAKAPWKGWSRRS